MCRIIINHVPSIGSMSNDDVRVYCNTCDEFVQDEIPRGKAVLLEAAHMERTNHKNTELREIEE